ncbi:hypothetical protein HDV57DRAFT_510598 [Trichoderma longibrachiatum]
MTIGIYYVLDIFHELSRKTPSRLPLPPGVYRPSRTDLDLPTTARSMTGQKTRQIIVIHQVLLPLSPLLIQRLDVLLLVLSEDQVSAPTILAAHMLGQSSIRTAVNRLRHAKDVSAVVPLEVLLQMDLEVSVLIRRAARPGERGLAALGTELLVHVLGDVEAAVAPQHPRLQVCDARQRRRDKVEVDAQGDVLHGVIRRQNGSLQDLGGSVGACAGRAVFGLLLLEVGGSDPALVVGLFRCLLWLRHRLRLLHSLCRRRLRCLLFAVGSGFQVQLLHVVAEVRLGLWLRLSIRFLFDAFRGLLGFSSLLSFFSLHLSLWCLVRRGLLLLWPAVQALLARRIPQPPVASVPLALKLISQREHLHVRPAEDSIITRLLRKVGDKLQALGSGRPQGDERQQRRLNSRPGGGVTDFANDVGERVELFGSGEEHAGGRIVLDQRAGVEDKAVDRFGGCVDRGRW